MPTLTISERTFNNFKEEQLKQRKQTGKNWSADKLLSHLLEISKEVKK